MRARWSGPPSGAALGFVAALVVSPAHADCTKDIECKGDRVCEEGRCVSPPLLPTPPPPPVARTAHVDDADFGDGSSPPPPDHHTPTNAPVLFGVGFDFGAAMLGPQGDSPSVLYDQGLSLGVSGGHFGGVVAGRFGLGDWLFGEVEVLGRYYLFDRPWSPFLTVGFVPWLAELPGNAPKGYQGTGGQAVVFEVGHEILRADEKIGLRFKLRVDVPFYSLTDYDGSPRSFWLGSLGVEMVARKFPDNFWML
ncbi:MAG TPA: hypothetical protein VIF09_24725 [Polyangiaceae bacterium]